MVQYQDDAFPGVILRTATQRRGDARKNKEQTVLSAEIDLWVQDENASFASWRPCVPAFLVCRVRKCPLISEKSAPEYKKSSFPKKILFLSKKTLTK